MRPVSAEKIAAVTGGRLYGDGAAVITGVSIDSRKCFPGALFAAIPGERADGQDYIASAFENGAVCALARREPLYAQGAVIVVPDVSAALGALAKWYRETLNIPVIGVTGSVGKTTTKEMIAGVLSERFAVHKTPGNLNNELGVPLTVFGIEPWHKAAVLELGISDFGEMTRLSDIARPDIAVITVIGHAHLERLGDRLGVLRAKTELVSAMPPGGRLIVNGDDELLRSYESPVRKILYGSGKSCFVRAERVLYQSERITCDIVRGARRVSVIIPGYGEHLLYAALAAAAAGFELGLTDSEIFGGLAKFETVGRRALMEDTGYLMLLDDCYNSNPTSCASALRSLAALKGRRVAILGDMLELGESAPALPRATGELASELGIDAVLCCGPLSSETAAGAGGAARWYETKEALIAALPETLRQGDAVLVKASRSMRFEEVSEAVKVV